MRKELSSDVAEVDEFPDIYIQPPSQEPLWSATPLLLFFYFLVVYGGFLSFTIANTMALWVETGVFQFPDPVLEYHRRGHQWEPTYESINFTSLLYHGIACLTMIPYPPEKKTKYDFIHQPVFRLSLLGLFFVWEIYTLVSNPTRFTTELLQTANGIFIAHTLFRGLILSQFFLTSTLLFSVFRNPQPLIRLPEDFNSQFLPLLMFLPLFPCYFFQYATQDGSMFFVLYYTLFYGFAYLNVYMDQR